MNTRHHYLSLLRTFALATLTAAAVTACTDDNGDPAGNEPITPADGIPVTFTANINPGSDAATAGAPDTRTVLKPDGRNGFTVEWKGKDTYSNWCDQICTWAAQGTTTIGSKTYAPITSAASSALVPYTEGDKLTLPSSGKWDFTAIYGYSALASRGRASASISPLTQSAPGNTEHIAAADFSVATAEQQDIIGDNSEMPAIISFNFHHMLSALQLQVKNGTGEALTVKEIRLSVTGENITTQKYYGVTDKGWIDYGKLESDYLQLKIQTPAALASNATEPQKFHMLLFPGYENKTLIITVITDHGEYTLTKGAPSGGFLAGKNYLTDITITSTPGTGETWTETISTPEQLAAFRDRVNGSNGYTSNDYAGKTVRLLKNITLTGTWTPIGNSTNNFKGTFDGGGYHINGLNVDNGSNDYAGLFGYVKDGTVSNLRVKGTVTTTGKYAGGIIGALTGTTVENCIFSGEVNGGAYVGGIAGGTSKSSSITGQIAGCHAKGKVTATSSVAGGIVGSHSDITMTDCYSEAEVTATSYMAGGIVGNSRNSAITRCYATGAISSGKHAGGIVGYNYGTTVTNCFALNPSLTRTSGSETTFGRVVGYNQGSSNVAPCFAFKDMTIKDATSDIIGGATSVAGDDLTAAACLNEATYTGRGFTTTDGWVFDNAATWTYLPWNKAFESFHNINETDYRISVPQHITNALSN